MNSKTVLSIALLLRLAMPLLADPVARPMGSQGEVTLDWQKFNELWMKMQSMEKKIVELEKPENLPPIPFTITKAAYKGIVGEKKTDIVAIFEIDVYDPKNWVKIPFLPAGTAITMAKLNGQPVGVLQEDGYHQILLKKPGRYVLEARFAMKSPKPEEAPQLFFNIQSTPMTLLALEFARPNLDVQIEPSQGVDNQLSSEKHTLVTAALSPTTNVTVRWQKALPVETAGPAKVYLDSQNLITVSEGTLRAHWNLRYSILRHGVRELKVLMPQDWNILSVVGDGLQEWKTIDSPKGPVLLMQLAYARKGNLDVGIQMERALSDKDEVMDLPRLKAIDIEREQGTIGIEAKGAIELTVQNAEGLQAIDPQELPAGVSQSATQPLLFGFRYTKPFALAVGIKRHPETPVLTTTVDDANAVSVMTPRGQLITKIRYQVRNQLKQFLAVRLPESSELWSAFVQGEPVKPTRAEDGSYRIPLAKSQLGSSGQQGFPVELIYYRRVPKFLPVGFRAMTLPIPDAPLSRVWWSVYLPEKYRFPYFGGDLEKGDTATVWGGLTGGALITRVSSSPSASSAVLREEESSLKKDFKGLAERIMAAKSKNDGFADQAYAKQASLAESLFEGHKNVPAVAGVFPVAFELPASGQMFTFGQIMVVGQDPKLTLMFLHERILHGAALLMILVAAYFLLKMGFWRAIRGRMDSTRLWLGRRGDRTK